MSPANPAFSISARRSFSSARPTKTAPTIWRRCLRPFGSAGAAFLGLAGTSKTTQNIMRTGECVLNLPSVDNVAAVNLLARTTGSNPVPEGKVRRGYRFMRLPPALSVIASSAPLPSPSHRARPWLLPVIHVVQPRRRFAFDHAPPDTSQRRARRTAWMAGHRAAFGRTPVLRRAMPGHDGKGMITNR